MGLLSKLMGRDGPSRSSAPRVRPALRDPVRVHIVGPNSLDILNARDISVSGLSVYVSHRFEGCDIASEVELVITLPSVRAFKARGIVRHHTSQGDASPFFGVEFTEIQASHSELIASYVSERTAAGA